MYQQYTCVWCLLAAMVVFTGCCPHIAMSARKTVDGMSIPLALGEGLANASYSDTVGRLRYDCLYVEVTEIGSNHAMELVGWQRFWPNGRSATGRSQLSPDQWPAHPPGDRWSGIGRFCIDKDRIEFEALVPAGGCQEFWVRVGVIRPDGVIVIEGLKLDGGRFLRFPKPYELHPRFAGKMERLPDW